MKKIIALLKSIFSIITMVFDLLVLLVEGFTKFLLYIPDAISALTQTLGYLPSIFVLFGSASITVMVIYVILGRNHD